jgi:hypothetical protein
MEETVKRGWALIFAFAVGLLWAFALCGCAVTDTPISPDRQITLLIIHNANARGHLAVYDRNGRIATLNPGEKACVRLRQTTGDQALAYRMEGRFYYTVPPWAPESSPGWVWEFVGIYQSDALGPIPADQCVR